MPISLLSLPWRQMLASAALGQETTSDIPRMTIEAFDAAKQSLGVHSVPKVIKSDLEWRQQLSARAYSVTRADGTEHPFTGPGWDNHANGLYRCVGCGTALFDSAAKFDSGTGWPSFSQPIAPTNITEHTDRSLFMERVAVNCACCNAHLGHVFDDGYMFDDRPEATGKRYCMNAVALTFVPVAKVGD